jgi:hypothetical protein
VTAANPERREAMTKLRMEWPLPKSKPALVLTRPDFETVKMGQTGDFEKGEANGAIASLALIDWVASAWLGTGSP